MESMGTRGSDRLAYLRKESLTDEHLDRLAGLGDSNGVRLVGWHPQIAVHAPTGISARFLVNSSRFRELIERLEHEILVNRIIVRPIGVPVREALFVEAEAG